MSRKSAYCIKNAVQQYILQVKLRRAHKVTHIIVICSLWAVNIHNRFHSSLLRFAVTDLSGIILIGGLSPDGGLTPEVKDLTK